MKQLDESAWRRVDTIEVGGPVAVIGDIHGRLDLLQALLARLDALHPAGRMPVFVVGDVIDRGPDSRGVVGLLCARGARGVRGNHEEWFIRYAHGAGLDPFALVPHIGGRATLASYGLDVGSRAALEAGHDTIPGAHRAWLNDLPVAMRLIVDGKPFWLAHAGVDGAAVTVEDPVRRMAELARESPDDFLWSKHAAEDMAVLDGPVISGHTSLREPLDAGHAIMIDTSSGVWEDGALTAVVLPRRRFVTVSADAAY